MDERLRNKLEPLARKNQLKGPAMIKAKSDRFEEVVQQLVEDAGMQYESEPMVGGKTPDGVIHHDGRKTYIEAVHAEGSEGLEDKNGELELCQLASPALIEAGLHASLDYTIDVRNKWGYTCKHKANPFVDLPSKQDADSLTSQIRKIAAGPSDEHGGWQGVVEIKNRCLTAFVLPRAGEPQQGHIGHKSCAIAFGKVLVEDAGKRLKANRERITKKIKKYASDDLGGHPMIVALYDAEGIIGHEHAAEIAYGSIFPSIHFRRGTDEVIPFGYRLAEDGIWNGKRGKRHQHIAAIWIFRSWNTATTLPLLAVNPFLDDSDVERMIPRRIMDVSVVCRPRPVGKVYT